MSHADVTIAVRDAIVAAIAQDHTASGGTYNLSATGQVRVGRWLQPPGSAAFACVATPTPVGRPDAASLRDDAFELAVDLRAWAPVAGDTPELRSDAALKLMGDILAAIKASRRDTGGALRAINQVRGITALSLTEIDGEEMGVPPGWASCFGTVVLLTHVTRGI